MFCIARARTAAGPDEALLFNAEFTAPLQGRAGSLLRRSANAVCFPPAWVQQGGPANLGRQNCVAIDHYHSTPGVRSLCTRVRFWVFGSRTSASAGRHRFGDRP